MNKYIIEKTGSKDFGPCDCCNNMSRTVWGFLHTSGSTVAAYYVQWTLNSVQKHGANFDFIIGKWGDGSTATDRKAVSLEFRLIHNMPNFMVIDSSDRKIGRSELVGKTLKREEVIGTEFAKQVFELVDAVWLHDDRIGEIVTT